LPVASCQLPIVESNCLTDYVKKIPLLCFCFSEK
jgi:hypothetical protein